MRIHFFIDKTINQNQSNVLKLYLLDVNTNDFTYSEVNNPFFLKESPFEYVINVENLEVVDHIEEFWYAKILKPTKIDVIEGYESGDSPILLMTPDEYSLKYTYTYNILGVVVTEEMVVGHYISAPDAIQNQGRMYAKLRIISEKTSSSYPDFNSTNTNFKIGAYADSYIRTVKSPGDAIDLAGWAANVSTGGFEFKVSFNKYKYTYGILSINAIYKFYETYTYGYTENFVNGYDLTRQVELKYKQGMLLTDYGHYYDAYFDIGHYNTNATKLYKVQFEYEIFNGMDYTYGGVQIIDRYLMYYSGI